MTAVEVSATTTDADSKSPKPGFRPDIEGMRAIAVTLVVLFHAGVPFLRGGYIGVDVFFVISGFVITASLLRDIDSRNTSSVRRFYAGRIRRLLPSATLLLITVAALSFLIMASVSWSGVGGDIISSSLFFANWHFAAQATDYMALPVGASPVLHFWSLGVEEQFYFIWPALMLGVARFARRKNMSATSRRRWLAAAIAMVGGTSLVWSVMFTESEGPWGYFGLQTRLWEIAAGAGLAIGLPVLKRLPELAALVLGVFGGAAIAYAAVFFNSQKVFPGSAALVPVLGTVALIAAGVVCAQRGVNRAIAITPMRYLGARSYTWYLWHWPALIFAGLLATDGMTTADKNALAGGNAVAPPVAAAIAVAVSLIIAIVVYRFFERPIRTSPILMTRTGVALAVGAALVATGVTGGVTLAHAHSGPETGNVTGSAGMRAIENGNLSLEAQAAAFTFGVGYDRFGGCWSDPGSAPLVTPCEFGDLSATRSLALIGDSHAAMWMAALDEYGTQQHYRIRMWARNNCAWDSPAKLDACQDWQPTVYEQLRATGPYDAVIITGKVYELPEGANPALLQRVLDESDAGAFKALEALSGATSHVIVLNDIPQSPSDVPLCVAKHLEAPHLCDFNADAVGTFEPQVTAGHERAFKRYPGMSVTVVDTQSLVCSASGKCRAVSKQGDLAYGDRTHVTPQMALELEPELGTRLNAILDGWAKTSAR